VRSLPRLRLLTKVFGALLYDSNSYLRGFQSACRLSEGLRLLQWGDPTLELLRSAIDSLAASLGFTLGLIQSVTV